MSNPTFYQFLCDRLNAGPVVLATVIASQGKGPQTAGAKMLIWGDAETAGTLGCDVDEIQVIQQAFEVLKTGIAQRLTLAVSDWPGALMTQSNEQNHRPQTPLAQTLLAREPATLQVWLTRWQGPDAIATAQAILEAFNHETPSRLVIPLITGQSPYVLTGDSPSLRNLQGQEAYIETLTDGYSDVQAD